MAMKRIEDLTVLQLYLMDCPRGMECKGCSMRRYGGGCALNLPKRLKEIRKWPIPDWLQPAIDEADKEIAYYRAHGGN